MIDTTKNYGTETRLVTAIQALISSSKEHIPINNFGMALPLLVAQSLGSFTVFVHNLKKPEVRWLEQLTRLMIGSLSMTQLSLMSYYFFVELNCLNSSLALCRVALYIDWIQSGLLAVLSVGSVLLQRPLQLEPNFVAAREEGTSNNLCAELSFLVAAHNLVTQFKKFGVTIALLVVQVLIPFGTFGYNLGKFGTEWREQIIRLFIAVYSLGQLGLISYEHFSGLNCQEASTEPLCQTMFFLNWFKTGLFAFLTVASSLYQRSIAKEINVARVRNFSSQGFFQSVRPTQTLETLQYVGPQTQQAPVVWSFRPVHTPEERQHGFFYPMIP